MNTTPDLGRQQHLDADTVVRLVDELMTRIPPSTDRAALEDAGHRALAAYRAGQPVAFPAPEDPALVQAVRRALLDHVRAVHATPAVVESAATRPGAEPRVERGAERVAVLVATLPAVQRRVIEGYFVQDQAVEDLAAELGLGGPELAETRSAALRSLLRASRR